MDFSKTNEMVERSRQLKCRQAALALLKRAKEVIPERYLRIQKETFKNVLFKPYYKDVTVFSDFVYDNFDGMNKVRAILIDGGNETTRDIASFAVLFRLITWDNFGLYKDCSELSHKLQTINSTENFNRNDISDELKTFDVLFIREFNKRQFKVHFDAGDFLDEILSHRKNRDLFTIISFTDAINTSNQITDNVCGYHLADLSSKEYCDTNDKFKNPANEILRIRVKNEG